MHSAEAPCIARDGYQFFHNDKHCERIPRLRLVAMMHSVRRRVRPIQRPLSAVALPPIRYSPLPSRRMRMPALPIRYLCVHILHTFRYRPERLATTGKDEGRSDAALGLRGAGAREGPRRPFPCLIRMSRAAPKNLVDATIADRSPDAGCPGSLRRGTPCSAAVPSRVGRGCPI